MLMGHPSLFAPPELHLAEFLTMRERERKITDSGMHWKTMGLVQTIAHLAGWHKWQAFHYLSHLTKRDLPVKEIYRLIHSLSPKQILVDKSPSLADELAILKRLEQEFESPRYLFITRHPYSVIESLMREQVKPPNPKHTFAEAEELWLRSNSNCIHFLEGVHRARWHRLSFEDLMSKTEETLRGITDFLKLPYSSLMPNAYEGDRLQDGIGCINFPKRKRVESELGEKWKHIQLPRSLSEETKAVATSLDYTLFD